MKAKEYYLQGFNCAEAVTKSRNCPKEVVEAVSNYGGGIANRGEICGALLGALATLGKKDYDLAQKIMDKFAEVNGSYKCIRGHKYKTKLNCSQRCELAENLLSKLLDNISKLDNNSSLRDI